MKAVKRVLIVALMAMALSIGAVGPMSAFGQKNDNRPPKPPQKIREPEKPPRNSNSQSNSNKQGRN